MHFFRHYKNKPYKYVDIAKHSETLEDLVVYQCRYPNDLATLWVRPKDMFFEKIEHEGKLKPRFENVKLEVREITKMEDADLKVLATLSEKIFSSWDPERFQRKFDFNKKNHLLIAFIDNRPVAFKLGFAESNEVFYSWMGGVLPEYRGLGIAQDLMKQQHSWCKNEGFKKIRTKTENKFRSMLILNLKEGFEVTATMPSKEGDLKIELQKTL